MRSTLLLVLLLTAACAVGHERAPFATSGPLHDPAPIESDGDASTPAAFAVAAPPRKILDSIGSSYTIVKAGAFLPSGDLEDLDDGISGELIFGRSVLSFLALEGSVGYLGTDGQFGSTQLDLYAIPVFVNARASLPVLFFEPYAGVGIGGMFVDYSASGLYSASDFTGAWNGFVGLEFGLGRLAIGAEYKYIQSADTKDDFAVEGSTASLFVSMPF
ncbi:MAG: outer membrane beta-barrel protein [Planctomycetes bacterium]|nr:outer membrane beta-barrel protein [Planctomycetota bacterium]MCB9886405.1 outer membrane beta-barrel protein [Planctomycetota bacterium]